MNRKQIAVLLAVPVLYLLDLLILLAGESGMTWRQIRDETKEAFRVALAKEGTDK